MIKMKEKYEKYIEENKIYLANYGLVGANGILKLLDLYLTYKGIELDPNFVELNPFMKNIVHNKPLTYFLSGLYVTGLAGLNYGAKKLADSLKCQDLNKVATAGLVMNIIGNLFIIGNNWDSLRELKMKNRWNI